MSAIAARSGGGGDGFLHKLWVNPASKFKWITVCEQQPDPAPLLCTAKHNVVATPSHPPMMVLMRSMSAW
jgi:hypothetical protein